MGGRPSKPAGIIEFEGISHRTNEELKQRSDAEKALLTGIAMQMWPDVRKNKKASDEFERVRELFSIIGKDDALHEGGVNRYCLLFAECHDLEIKRNLFNKSLAELKREYNKDKIDADKYFNLVSKLQGNFISLDKQIQSKRNMMLAIEKENLMTIASALRSIPKKVDKTKQKSGMAAFMSKRADSG